MLALARGLVAVIDGARVVIVTGLRCIDALAGLGVTRIVRTLVLVVTDLIGITAFPRVRVTHACLAQVVRGTGFRRMHTVSGQWIALVVGTLIIIPAIPWDVDTQPGRGVASVHGTRITIVTIHRGVLAFTGCGIALVRGAGVVVITNHGLVRTLAADRVTYVYRTGVVVVACAAMYHVTLARGHSTLATQALVACDLAVRILGALEILTGIHVRIFDRYVVAARRRVTLVQRTLVTVGTRGRQEYAFSRVLVAGIHGTRIAVVALFRPVLALARQRITRIMGACVAVIAVLCRVLAIARIRVAVVIHRAWIVVIAVRIRFTPARAQRVVFVHATQARVTPVLRAIVVVVTIDRVVHAYPALGVAIVGGTLVIVVTIPFLEYAFTRVRVAFVRGTRVVIHAMLFFVYASHCRIAGILGTFIIVVAVLGLETAPAGPGVTLTCQALIRGLACHGRMRTFSITRILASGLALNCRTIAFVYGAAVIIVTLHVRTAQAFNRLVNAVSCFRITGIIGAIITVVAIHRRVLANQRITVATIRSAQVIVITLGI